MDKNAKIAKKRKKCKKLCDKCNNYAINAKSMQQLCDNHGINAKILR